MSAPADLDGILRTLIAPLSPGDALAEGFSVAAISTALGPRVVLQRDGVRVVVEVALLRAGLRHAVATQRFGLSYRAGSGSDTVEPRLGQRLCVALAKYVGRNETKPDLVAPASTTTARVREVTVQQILEPQGTVASPFFGVSPYVGCVIGCRYCYAQSRLGAGRSLLGLPDVSWGSWVDVRINAAAVLADQLRAGVAHPIKFCPVVSDPYQAVEARYRVTRACLEVLAAAAAAPPTLVLTRSATIIEDLPRIARIGQAWVGVSLPTVDDAVRRHFEPRASSVSERLQVLIQARSHGIKTVAVVQPLLPGPIDALVNALADHADSVHVGVLTGEEGATADFDAPLYAASRAPDWQAKRHAAVVRGLAQRSIPVWSGELPPELSR